MKKRKHHYVWEHYLKAWETGGKVWCARGEKIFPSSTENIAHSRDFYRLKELSDSDVDLVKRLIASMGGGCQKICVS